jgi:tetratricopeptide (TPR) repeat protein
MSAPEDSIDAAIAAISSNNYGRAEAVLSAINDDDERRILRSLHLYAQVLEAQGRDAPLDTLTELARRSARDKTEEAFFYGEMATLMFQRKRERGRRLDKAAEFLEHAIALGSHPNEEMLLNNLCRAYYEIGNHEKLVECAGKLLEHPDSRTRAGLAGAHGSLRLQAYDTGARFLDGVLEHVDRVDPAEVPWFVELLLLYRRTEEAQDVVDGLEDGRLQPVKLDWLQAQIWFARHRFEATLSLLTEEFCRSDAHDSAARSRAFFMRGRCLDEAGDYAGAHAAFEAMNGEVRQRYRITAPPGPRFAYEDFDYGSLPLHTPSGALPYSPVFLIGFPRSGTTLLEALLDSRDDILTLSETRNLASARSYLREWNMAYPGDLGSLSPAQLDELRAVYFVHNSHLVPEGSQFATVIDKLPLNILHVPLIRTMFPHSKFLLSLRHPLDVALSCFQQNFEMTVEMAHFTRLEDALRRYDQVMSQFAVFCDRLDLPVLAVRYEELVADLASVMQTVDDFLGLDSGHRYEDFYAVRRRKPVLTPSNSQVSRELYESSSQRWRNYADQLLPHAALVESWIDRYESQAMPGEPNPR